MKQAMTERLAPRKALGPILWLAALTAVSLILTASPAHAGLILTVNSAADPGSGGCNGSECTLREAIALANRVPGADTIRFDLPGAGVKTISPTSELPAIGEAVTIDGYSQPGSSPNTLAKGTNAKILIELDGSNIEAFADGLTIAASNVTVRGLVINRFDGDADDAGIDINGNDAATGVKIEGNFIGTDATGQEDRGNEGDGVLIRDGQGHTVGGAAPEARNLISGNDRNGVRFDFAPGNNKVHGNLIGTKKDGASALGNGAGNATGDGVNIIGSSNNFIGGTGPGEANTIAFNKGNGVRVADFSGFVTTGNRILNNSVLANARLGIDLQGGTENAAGVTANDPKDPDPGPNDLQNKPNITSATTTPGRLTVEGKLNSTPNKKFVLQYFSDPSGNEGKVFLGQKAVTTNANGNAFYEFSFARTVPAGRFVTATATGSGNTSEFSAPRVVAQ